MALQNRTVNQRNLLANALARAEALVRQNVHTAPVNYPADVQAALVALEVQVLAAINA